MRKTVKTDLKSKLFHFRGNTYSRKHVWLDPDEGPEDESPYWDFSQVSPVYSDISGIYLTNCFYYPCRWHEMGKYDITASIRYVLNVTKRKKLSYVCLSFGCTLFFIAAIENEQVNHQVDSVYAMGPSTFMAHMSHPGLRALVRFYHQITVTQFYKSPNCPNDLTQ